MNYLPIVLIIAFFMLKNKDALNLISGLDLQTLTPLLNLLGVNEEMLKTLINPELISTIQSGGDIKTLLPTIIKTINAFNSNTSNVATKTNVGENLKPIEEFAGNEVLGALGNYFSQ